MPSSTLINPAVTKEKEETKQERFKRIVESRVNSILEKYRVLGNCTNKKTYSYTSEDVENLFAALEEELERLRRRFELEAEQTSRFVFNK